MNPGPDLYARLGVTPGASPEEIKAAYRRMARELHPDRRPGDREAEDRFKALTEAYDVLRDRDRRRRYDQDRSGRRPGSAGSARAGAPTGPPARSRGERGKDLRVHLSLSLPQMARGKRAEVELERGERCESCGGIGARAGSTPVLCPTCGGRGTRPGKGWLSLPSPCVDCGGQGKRFADACGACGGAGRRTRTRKIHVTVPPGIESGTRLRVRGEGEAGSAGGPPGDLYVVVQAQPHPVWKRSGHDLEMEVPVPFFDALLGGEVEIPTLTGVKTLPVPAGTESGAETTLPEEGMPSPDGRRRGVLRVRFRVEPPGSLTTEQRNLLERVRDMERRGSPPAAIVRYRQALRDAGEVDR